MEKRSFGENEGSGYKHKTENSGIDSSYDFTSTVDRKRSNIVHCRRSVIEFEYM